MKNKLFIFSNESVFQQENKFFCDNLDSKSTPEALNKKFEVNFLEENPLREECTKSN